MIEPNAKNLFIRIWIRYATFVEEAVHGANFNTDDKISYWRIRLFTKFITYLLPGCIIALVPGVFMALQAGYPFVAFSDIAVVVLIGVVSYSRKLNIGIKKLFVAIALYYLAIVLIVNLSLLGPGMIYLLAISVIITVTYPRYWAYWTIVANVLICILCAVIIHQRLFNSPLIIDYSLPVWITVSSNLIFLSFVLVMLVSNAVDGLEKAILNERSLQDELNLKNIRELENLKTLLESQDQYKSLFVLNPVPMWILSKKDLRFLQVNKAAVQDYGYTEEEFLSITIADIKLPEHMEALYAEIKQNEDSGIPVSTITQHRRKNQEPFFVEVTFSSIMYKGEAATLAISQDITRQMEYIKAIECQNDQLREIAHIQSHNVRGPLATILGLVQLFNEGLPDVETSDILQGILYSSQQLDKVIRETVNNTTLVSVKPAFIGNDYTA